MKRKVGELNLKTGKVQTGQMKRAREGDFDRAMIDTRAKRIIRALVH